MRNLAPFLPQQSRSAGIDVAIGQIDLIGEFGEIVKSWRIRSPRCTLGSGTDCSVQITTPGIAPLHAVLIFGKKHTLLRSVGPTLISNRHVREWLIDQPTEIAVGQSRLVIHPSIGVLATVVHAEKLLDHAARMGNVASPLIQTLPSASVDNSQTQPIATPIGANETKIDSAASARLDTIERLLESLQMSLDKMQASLGTEAKCANESIVESVTQEIDEFGKKLFTNLNDQWNNQAGVQQLLISHLADKFSDRFHAIDEQLSNQTGTQQSLFTNLADRFTDQLGAIDEQLNRFSEATSKHTSSLNELLAQAGREQEIIEARFNEVISHRNELIDAVHVLRSEIALAYQAPEYPDLRSANGSEVAESAPDHTYADESSQASYSRFSDDQLAQSLERAQIQIQELNAQLRLLEVERDSAQQKVELLIESWPSEQPSEQTAFQSDPGSEIPYGSPDESNDVANDVANDESNDVANDVANYEGTSDESSQAAETNEVISDHNQLPAWFKQDAPAASNVEWAANPSYAQDSPVLLESESNFASFSAPDLTSYSDIGYESAPLENIPPLDQPEESSNSNLDSISERLQRMLIDADHRRGTSNPSSELRTSSSWSQKYSNQPKEGFKNREPDPIERNVLEDESGAEVEPSYPDQVVPVVSDSPVSEGREPHFPDSLRHLYRDQPIEQMAGESTDASDSIDSSYEADRSGTVEDQTNALISPTSNAGANSVKRGSDEEESIEDYMQRLLHRVRGGAENSPTEIKSAPTTPSPTGPAKPRSRIAASMGLDKPDSEISLPEEKLNEELFVPRQQAPEQRNDLVALRELANTNARRAITRSDMRRTNSAFFVKLGVTALAVSSAAALFMFNGLTLNAPFVGMLAAVIVAVLWGYDCVNHFNRLKNVGGLNKVTAAETAAGQSIRVSSAEESGWRPTSD